MEWLKKQWEQVRGNAKWDLLKTGLVVLIAGIGIWLRSWFFALSLPVQILSVVVVLLSIACVVLTSLLIKARNRPFVKFSGPPPAFLFPRKAEAQTASAQHSDPSPFQLVGAFSARNLRIRYQMTDGPAGGVTVRLEISASNPSRIATSRLFPSLAIIRR